MEAMMNNIVLRMLAAGAFTVLALPVIAQSQQPFEPYEIPVPSTSSISYRMIDARRVGDGQIEVIVRTTGKISGDIYARKLVDCTRPRYQNRGEFETLEGLKTRTGYREWFRVVPDSTDEALYKAACERLTLLKP
jgi:hypothetical protein